VTQELAPGQTLLGRYQLDRRLDEGGMSVVWAATHAVTGKEVALKLLKADAAKDEATRRRMLREARAACAVRHPNVVEIHDVLELPDGSPVLVMDLLRGESLRDRLIRRRTLPIDEAATLLLPVVSAVGTAHAAGIVHRDLKPENIFLAQEAGDVRVKVLDFGIAKMVATSAAVSQVNALTNTGTMLGTPYYMAPEQILGEAVDHRADVWSIGVILYECLAGERPTEAENVGKILKRVLTNEIEPLSKKAPALPADVTALVDRMLSQNAAERPQSLQEVGEVLARYAQGVSLGRFGPPSRATEPGDSGPRAGAADPTTPTGRHAAELADTLMAARPDDLPPKAAPAASAATTEASAGQAPRREKHSLRSSWALPATAAVLVAGGAAVGTLFFYKKGPERTPYVRATASVQAAPSGACPAGMALLPAGTFKMGSDEGKEDERPIHEVAVGAFCLDLREATSEEYNECMQRGACRQADSTVGWRDIPADIKERDSQSCTAYQAADRALPINCISWTDADAYCQAAGKRLPTEAEWEYAAGGAEHRRFPWGDAPPSEKLLNACDRSCVAKTERLGGGKQRPMFDADDGFPQLAPPGSFPAGDTKQGVHDMAGNVWEWTASPYCTYPEHGCASQYRVFRGGGWGGLLSANLRVSARMWSDPSHRYNDVGFRCARDLK
jgi:formylglycine-generating enzyme required for sulfatase activity/tRNA A-37 threonylcarbamoyl transferase component Bud32